jgi:lysozyme
MSSPQPVASPEREPTRTRGDAIDVLAAVCGNTPISSAFGVTHSGTGAGPVIAEGEGMTFPRRWWILGVVGALGCAGTGREATGTSGSDVTACATGTTLKGVDVSHWDGTVNWSEVKAAGITFAFAKATESTGDLDDTFAANWAGMKSAGIVRGAYHFFDPAVSASSQASYVLKTVGTLEAGDLPIVLDFEQLNGVSEATAVADAVTFLKAVTQATGKTAILYMSADFLSGSYPALAPYTLWVANYGVSCPGMPSGWSTWSFWQSSDSGSVSGISDAVDLDSFNGSLSALTALAGGSSSGSSSSGGSSSGSSSSGSSSGGKGGSSSGGSSSGCSSSGSSGSSSGGSSSSGSSSGGSSSGSCQLGGKTYAMNTCTETLQCDSGSWVDRYDDATSCDKSVEPSGACITDSGSVVPQNTCTSTLQCDDGVWVDRYDDPTACL